MIRQRVAALILMALQAMLIAEYSARGLAVLLIVGVSAIGLRRQFRVPTWVHVVLAFLACIGFFAYNINFPPSIRNDWILPGRYAVAFGQALLVLQMLEMLLIKQATTSGLSVRFIAFAMTGFLIAFCRAESPQNWLMFFLFAVLFGLLNCVYCQRQITDNDVSPRGKFKQKNGVFYVGLAFALVLGTSYLANATKVAASMLRFVVLDEVAEAQELATVAQVAYAATGKLDIVSRFKVINPNQTALYLTCSVTPGYLRGRVFTELTQNGWKQPDSELEIRELTLVNPSTIGISTALGKPVFKMTRDSTGPFRRVSVRNNRRHVGNIAFAPLPYSALAAYGSMIDVDQHGIIRDGLAVREEYDFFVAKDNEAAELSPSMEASLLAVPNNIHPSVIPVVTEICDRATLDLEKINRVENFFRTQYTYSLESFRTNGMDRVSYFILNKPPSHCEYFATAAVVALRLNGVPARYVTGFAAHEFSNDEDNLGDMWVAKNRDAHAWVEAFDRQQKKWVIVEPTPNVNIPKSLWDEESPQRFDSNDTRGRHASSTTNLRSLREYIAYLGRNYIQGIVNSVVSVLLVALTYYLWRTRKSTRTRKKNHSRRFQARQLRQLEKRLRKLQLIRHPAETLHQYSERLRQYHGDETDWVHDAADVFLDYAVTKYSGVSAGGQPN